jgi:hypothetical protein
MIGFRKQRGALLLIFVVVTLVGGTTGYLAIRAAQEQGAKESAVIDKIARGEPIGENEVSEAIQGKVTAIKILTAGGSVVNAIEPSPDAGSVLSSYATGCIEKGVEQASLGDRPTASKPLPADVTAPAIPGCTSGIFLCSNGNTICRDKVCNDANNCGDNSDERSSMCRSAGSCCQVTNGCPGETGSSCAESCCCCPYGMACDRVNPGRGCVPSN